MSFRFSSAAAISALTASTFLFGCFSGSKTFVNLKGKGEMALVSYSLNKSITEKGQEDSSGPGLLQSKKKYYKDHVAALEAMYGDFADSVDLIFSDVSLVDIQKTAENEFYKERTVHVPKIVMGKDIATGSNELTTAGINYVSTYDTELLDSLSDALGVPLLLLVSNSANYNLEGGAQIGLGNLKVGGGAAKMNLTTTVTIYEKGVGTIMNRSFTGSSDERIPMIQGTISTEHYPKCLRSAHSKNMAAVAMYLREQKEAAAAAEQAQTDTE